jgi:hypothetical protein
MGGLKFGFISLQLHQLHQLHKLTAALIWSCTKVLGSNRKKTALLVSVWKEEE